MIYKNNSMLNFLKCTSTVFFILLLIACGSSSKEEKGNVNDKKSELQKLKSEQNKINEKTVALEKEIALLDTTTARRAKLVGITTLAVQNFIHYIDLQGKVDAENISYVSPRGAPGMVRSLYIKAGDQVRKGQLILKMEDALARQGVSTAKQTVEGINTQLTLAKNLYQRYKNLWDQGIGTEVQLLNAKNNVDALENQLKQTEEGVKMAQEQLNQTNVYSTVTGVADLVNVREGELFQGATAVGPQIRIVNKSHLKAVVDVPENYLSSIKPGTAVVIEINDVNKKFNATISRIGQTINANSRGAIAEANIPSDPALKPNQLLTVKIKDYASNNTIVIPLTTIQTDISGKYVYIMENEKGKQIARKKPIVVGQIYGEMIEVKSGLLPGQFLINQGYQGVYDGQDVITEK